MLSTTARPSWERSGGGHSGGGVTASGGGASRVPRVGVGGDGSSGASNCRRILPGSVYKSIAVMNGNKYQYPRSSISDIQQSEICTGEDVRASCVSSLCSPMNDKLSGSGLQQH